MLVTFFRLRNEKEPLIETKEICPICGKPLFLLRHKIYRQYCSVIHGKEISRSETLICPQCGQKQELNQTNKG